MARWRGLSPEPSACRRVVCGSGLRPAPAWARLTPLPLIASLMLLCGSALADDLVVLSLAPAGGVFRDAFDTFEANVERAFGESTDVVLLVSGEAGTEEGMLSAIRRGRGQFGVLTVPGTSTAVPELGLLMAPYLFNSFAEADYVLDEFLAEPVAELFAARGLTFLQWIDSGWWNLFATRTIATPEDGRGLRLRAASGDANVAFLRSFGADVIPLPFAELVPGLQTGLIEGGATNTAMYVAVGIHEHAPHLTLTRHAINPGVALANKRWFDGLSADRQQIIREAFVSSAVLRAGVRREEREALETLHSLGLEPYEPSAAELARWHALARPLHAELIRRIGGQSATLYSAILAGKAAFAARHNRHSSRRAVQEPLRIVGPVSSAHHERLIPPGD